MSCAVSNSLQKWVIAIVALLQPRFQGFHLVTNVGIILHYHFSQNESQRAKPRSWTRPNWERFYGSLWHPVETGNLYFLVGLLYIDRAFLDHNTGKGIPFCIAQRVRVTRHKKGSSCLRDKHNPPWSKSIPNCPHNHFADLSHFALFRH